METEVRDALVGTVIDGRYRVDRRIARGGMATVYEALDLRLERTVALKVMHATLAEDPGFVSRFEREAKAAARLSHPNVVSVFDQGVDGDVVFLAMEYVPGRTVRDVLRSHGPLTAPQALTILAPVLEALEAAHRAGFVHRDIKPENVLISDDGRVKVADFGLARTIATSSATATQGMLIGTVAYLSPEQVERGVADARSDVYGAGILLFEMVTGAVPHSGDTPLAVAYRHVNTDVPAPSSIRSDVPPAVDALVAEATRRDPDERLPSAWAFREAVEQARRTLPAPTALTERETVVLPATAHPSDPGRTAVPPPAPAATSVPPGPPTAETPVPPAAPEPRRRRRWRGPIALLLVVLLAVAGGATAWWLGSARYVTMPSVAGLTEPVARQKLAGVELGLAVSARQFSETVKSGQIISSDPSAGAEARRGSDIGVVVSKGPERFKVPDLAGSSVADATAALADLSLKVAGQKKVYDEKVDVGLVAGTAPDTGTPLKRGAAVTLLVSRGPKPVAVPKLIGDDGQQAIAALEELGLKVTTTEEYSDTIDPGNVVSVSPTSATMVSKGSTVELVLSKGPPPVTVPNVVDLDRDTAVAKLKAAGLKVRLEEPLSVTPLNRVLKQTPAAGQVVPAGSTVTLQIV